MIVPALRAWFFICVALTYAPSGPEQSRSARGAVHLRASISATGSSFSASLFRLILVLFYLCSSLSPFFSLSLSLFLPSPALVVRVRATECERARDSEIVIAVVSTDWISYLVRTENWCYINQSTTPKITPSRFVVVVVQVDWPATQSTQWSRDYSNLPTV